MPAGIKGFQKGNPYGGYRENAGRPTGTDQERLTLLQALEREEERQAAKLAKRYYEMAHEDPATMRHVVDGKRVKNGEQQPTAIIHQFIQFGASDPNTIQLSAEELSSPVLGGDDSGAQEASGNDMASPERQRQDSIEFRSFANVPRKRR